MTKKFIKFLKRISNLKLSEILLITLVKISLFNVGSFIKFLKSLLFEIKFKKAFAFISTFTNELESFANSYKAKEYLLAEVSENPLFLLNFYPSNEYD